MILGHVLVAWHKHAFSSSLIEEEEDTIIDHDLGPIIFKIIFGDEYMTCQSWYVRILKLVRSKFSEYAYEFGDMALDKEYPSDIVFECLRANNFQVAIKALEVQEIQRKERTYMAMLNHTGQIVTSSWPGVFIILYLYVWWLYAVILTLLFVFVIGSYCRLTMWEIGLPLRNKIFELVLSFTSHAAMHAMKGKYD